MADRLGLSEAKAIVDAMLAEADKRGIRFAAAVVDPGGETICLNRMDKASAVTARMSVNKAYTAVKWQRDTRLLHDNMFGAHMGEKRREIAWFGDERFAPVWGGVVIAASDGTLLGALGGSGGTPTQDEEIGQVGLAAFKAL